MFPPAYVPGSVEAEDLRMASAPPARFPPAYVPGSVEAYAGALKEYYTDEFPPAYVSGSVEARQDQGPKATGLPCSPRRTCRAPLKRVTSGQGCQSVHHGSPRRTCRAPLKLGHAEHHPVIAHHVPPGVRAGLR